MTPQLYYVCDYCGFKSTDVQETARHMRQAHPNEAKGERENT